MIPRARISTVKPFSPSLVWGSMPAHLLRGCWMMAGCEGGSGFARDYARMNLNNATFVNSPTWIQDKGGIGINFASASAQYLNLANTQYFVNAAGSLDCIVSLTDFAAISPIVGVFGTQPGLGSPTLTVFGINTSGQVFIQRTSSAVTNAANGDTVLTAGQIYHIAFTGDGLSGGSGWKMYVNGVRQNLTITSGSNFGTFLSSNTATPTARIGSISNFGGTPQYMNGNIYYLRIWTLRVLTAEQVLDLKTNPYRMFASRRFK